MEIGLKDFTGWQFASPINARTLLNLCKPCVQNHVFIDWSKRAYKETRQSKVRAIISLHCKYFFQAEMATPYK